MKIKLKKPTYRHYIYYSLIALTVVLAVFLYRTSYIRLWQSLCNFVTSIGYYFVEVLDLDFTVNTDISNLVDVDISTFMPFSVEEALYKLKALPAELFKWENFLLYLKLVLTLLENLLLSVVLLGPALWLLFKIVILRYLKRTTGNGISKPLRFYLAKVRPKTKRVACWFWELLAFGAEKRFFLVLGIMWLLNLNVASIVISAFAFYFYFVASFDIVGLLANVVNLIVDLAIMLSGLPLLIWLIIARFVVCAVREHIGYNRLRHNENKNRGFIKGKLSLVNLITGYMRAGKNTTETDIALSAELIHKDMALEGMVDAWYKFPELPWRNLEIEVERALAYREITGLPEARIFAEKKRERFLKDVCPEKLYGYDIDAFPMEYDNGMYIETVFDVVETYVQYYSMYVAKTSLIQSNYAVRSGAIRLDNGHFPLWTDDFFRSPSVRDIDPEQMSHIIDFDKLRLGKRVDMENPAPGIASYGIYLWSERGKERGNAVENQSYKKDDYKANPKNDLSNLFLKMAGHNASVDFKNFFLSIGDEQRADSVGADEREVSTLLHIDGNSEEYIALPLFELEILIHGFFRNRLDPFLKQYRYNRSDGTLFKYMLHHLVAKFNAYYTRKYNTFGYKVLNIGVEKGVRDGNIELHPYYISRHKTFGKRFSSDCFRNVLAVRALKARQALIDMPTYKDICADMDELRQQNSYFINDLDKYLQN